MKPKIRTYPDRSDKPFLDVDTGFKNIVVFYLQGETELNVNDVKELVEQLSTWLGYMAVENG